MHVILLLVGILATACSVHAQSTTKPLFTTGSPILPSSNCSGNQVLENLRCIDNDLQRSDSSLAQFLAVAGLSACWVIYLTFFNSRILGLILTKVINAFVKEGYLKLGSFSFSVLSGKVMFRDVEYITTDSSVYIYDGYCIFRWWRPYKFSPWRKKKDLNEGHTRLSVFISGLEYHVYNRSSEYGRLEKLFGIDSQIFVDKPNAGKSQTSKDADQKIARWRNLIPVIKIQISYGKVIFGNKLLPSTLVAAYEDVSAQYNTAKASNMYDLFMHVLEGNIGSVKVMLINSPKYDPSTLPHHKRSHGRDPPPRKMGEGYDLIHSNNVFFKYIWDEPGKTGIPSAESHFSEYEAKAPDHDEEGGNTVFELEVRCDRRVTLNYGPWADRQINHLWRFYYPLDYQKLQVTEESKQGELRSAACFNMYISLLQPADIDLLFLKDDEPSAIHINVNKGTCVAMRVPMVITENGFTTHISGQLIYPNASTSMSYRPLLNAEMLSFTINANYPLIWNDEQLWICDIKASKVSASLIFEHKNFIADLMEDWSSKDAPDLLSFYPYKMKFSFDLQEFELGLPANEYNWIDCATKRKENALIDLTGQSLKIDFTLPFNSFLAPTFTIPFYFHIHRAELCLFLPQSNPSRTLLLNLRDGMDSWNSGAGSAETRGMPTTSRAEYSSGTNYEEFYHNSHKLRKDPKWGEVNHEWVKCWDAPEMDLVINYKWHPVVSTREEFRQTDADKELEKADKVMQRSIRSSKKSNFWRTTSTAESTVSTESGSVFQDGTDHQSKSKSNGSVKFDPTSLDPDEISVEFALKPGSTLFLYGSLLHHFVAIKENYLGVDDKPTDFVDGQQLKDPDPLEPNNNPLSYRTLQVTVNVNLHNVRGVLPVHWNPTFKTCPIVRLKRLTFEMDKNYHQTRLQLLLSKLAIEVEDNNSFNIISARNMDGRKGWLMLMDLQLRGHAMFSGAGLPLGAVTIEYGWLTEVLVGPVTGNLSIPQIQLLAQWAEMFVFLLKNSLHEMKPAFPNKYAPTGMNWEEKKMNGNPIEEGDVKYLMAQVKLDSVKVRVSEKDSALDLSISPILISNGNMQFPGVKEAASIRIHEIMVKQRIKKALSPSSDSPLDSGLWLEAGEVRFGSLHAMITVATPEREMSLKQNKFLCFHDKMTRRLHFLWQASVLDERGTSVKSPLSSVRTLKSWGCNFFTPLTSKHPTYFYKNRNTLTKQNTIFNGHTNPQKLHVGENDSSSSKEDDSDDNSDVFDPGMEYGMSLLAPGKCLLSRSRISTLSKSSLLDSADEAASSSLRKIEMIRKPGPILGSAIPEESHKEPSLRKTKPRPSLKRQNKIVNSTGHIFQSASSTVVKRSSVLRKLKSTAGTVASQSKSGFHPQVSFAPSPEKRSVLKKSSSQADIDMIDRETSKQSIKRVRSSDSNLYRSAESEFRSTTSLSSADFYSAESDLEDMEDNAVVENTQSQDCDAQPAPVRPGTLPLESNVRAAQNHTSTVNTLLTPTITKSSSMSPGSVGSYERSSSDRRDSVTPPLSQAHGQSLFKCYESHLTLLTLNPVNHINDDEEGWFDEKVYRLPSFSVTKEGVHPSVMIDKDMKAEEHLRKMESANRELTFEELDSSGKSTSVAVHLRESLDVQLTPYLLTTITHVIDAATPVLKHDDPVSVISQLEMHCINEAADRIPEDQDLENSDSADEDKKKGDKYEKSKPSLKRQKRTEGSADDVTKLDQGLTVTRPLPGTKLSVKVDRVRINVIQTSLGNDKIFSVVSHKAPPVQCVTILATRLDALNISVDLNSRRKNRLMIENLRKMSRSYSAANIIEPSDPEKAVLNKKKMSVSSDITNQKHFLVLLNAKASAKSVAVQMRSLTSKGYIPERTSITALSDKACQAPFCFDPAVVSCELKELVEKWHAENEDGISGSPSPRKLSRYQAYGPPQPWGWVMLEAGVDRIKVNVVKQISVEGSPDWKLGATHESFANSDVNQDVKVSKDGIGEDSAFDESVHVHFVDESLRNMPESPEADTDVDWAIKDSNLHASQGELFIGSVWINVPSPHSENSSHGKALRTWNLLSCVSASIKSWLDPADQLATSFSYYNEEKLTRQCSVIACILTDALDRLTSGEHGPEKPMELIKLKYDVLTHKAKLLRKDPNFLLSHELQTIVGTPEGKQTLISALGQHGNSEKQTHEIPALSTLKKGVFAMIRQLTSNYSGIISSSKLKNMGKNGKKNEILYSGYNEMAGDQERQTAPTPLVVHVEPPLMTSEMERQEVHTDAVPMRMPRPVLKPEKMSVVAEEASSLSDAEKGQANEMAAISPSAKTNPSGFASAEKLVKEQQQSMYSWMSNAAKSNAFAQPVSSSHLESQPLIQNETGYEETDFMHRISPHINRKQSKAKKENTMIITNSEDVFEIFLRNVGLDVDSPVPVKSSRNKSFIEGECLGSLSVNVKLKLLRIDKQEPDPRYSLQSSLRKKRKSVKSRKPRAFYSSMEHARETRNHYSMDGPSWPPIYPGHSLLPIKPSPILLCQEIEVKSSIIESDLKPNEKKDLANSIALTSRSRFIKDRKTLNVGAMLSVDHIVQHVDVALLRLMHQVSQISDNIQQAKTDIQVNKYTEGSISPDFKVLHRRTISILSEASNISASRINRQNSVANQVPPLKDEQPYLQEYVNHEQNDENDADDESASHASDTMSSASTEVPHCWQVMYKMVDLYESLPENKADTLEKTADSVHMENENLSTLNDSGSVSTIRRRNTLALPQFDPFLALTLRGTASVKKFNMHAAIGDLKLNAELSDLVTKVNHSKEVVNTFKSNASSKFITTLNGVGIMLIDQARKQRHNTIAKASIKKSCLDASTNHLPESSGNIAKLHLGLINFDLSQHPASLHDVFSRGTRQLSAHISEFALTPTPKTPYLDQVDSGTPYTPATPALSTVSSANPPMTPVTPSALTTLIDLSSQDSSSAATSSHVNAQFELSCDGVAIVATLLPSLHASYKTGEVKGEGQTGMDATFSFSLPNHVLKFTALDNEEHSSTVINLPKIEIEGEYKQGERDVLTSSMERWKSVDSQRKAGRVNTDLMVQSGDYLFICVNIGSFEHTLTTDLLSQLIFLQEVFLKEINQMVEKVSKTSKPVPLWSQSTLKSETQPPAAPLLYQLKLQLKGIQITAATPSLNAARLKTGEMMFELSNRVMQSLGRKSKRKKKGLGIDVPKYLKLFGKAQVDLTLSLGTLVLDSVYPEAEDEFRELAYFTTRIGLQNTREGNDDPTVTVKTSASAASGSSATATGSKLPPKTSIQSLDERLQNLKKSEDSDNSIVLISLMRPLFFVQPTAFDKAILVYLSYKNAYEDWKEQQKNVVQAAKQVRDVFQSARARPNPTPSASRSSTPRKSSVFLQLSVNDMGICLPVAHRVFIQKTKDQEEVPSAMVLTIDNTLISASYTQSLVTEGQMKGFCMRFADDFQTTWDDWKQDLSNIDVSSPNNFPMNALVVPEGTYKISSDTTTSNSQGGGPAVAKTSVNVLLQMKGMDIHFDTKIGSYFSRLADTLLAITGQDEPTYDPELDMNLTQSEEEVLPKEEDTVDGGVSRAMKRTFSYSSNSSSAAQPVSLSAQMEKNRKIEHEINEQAKVIKDLRQLGAKPSYVKEEEKRLAELEMALSSNFRKVVRSRFRRSSIKSSTKESKKKFKQSHHRAKSATVFSGREISTQSSMPNYSTLPRNTDEEWRAPPISDSHSAEAVSYRRVTEPAANRLPYNVCTVDNVDADIYDRNYGLRESYYTSETETESSVAEDEVDGPVSPSVGQEHSGKPVADTGKFTTSKSENSLGNLSQTASSPPEAEIQLELEVQAEVDGGRIECHPHPQEIDTPIRQDYGMMPPTYPASKVRNFVKNTTVFYIPGMNVNVQYNSASSENSSNLSLKEDKIFSFSPGPMETLTEQSESIPDISAAVAPPAQSLDEDLGPIIPQIEVTTPSQFMLTKDEKLDTTCNSKMPNLALQSKRACVRAMLNLQSLPEMVISPYLLDFLEQTLNEIVNMGTPQHSFSQKYSGNSSRIGSLHGSSCYSEEETSDVEVNVQTEQQPPEGSVLSSDSTLNSLPLDVVVEVNVQPSQVRFNCVPMSRVECLLQIPSIDLKFSSIAEDIAELPFASDSKGEKKQDDPKTEEQADACAMTGGQSPKGLNFSAVLSDFSIYVFHPYGGKQSTSGGFPLDASSSFVGSPGSSDSPFAKTGSGRRDSLSVNLEFVKITLVRRRKGDTILVADLMSPGNTKAKVDNVVVHVSGLLDVGKAAFKYDMRRLNEILAFPKAWYRRSIARRLFLGDTSEQSQSNSPHMNRKEKKRPSPTKSSLPTPVDSSILNFLTADSPLSPTHRQLSVKSSTKSDAHKAEDEPDFLDNISIGTGSANHWRALVMLKLKMSRLDVDMNMSNVMGTTVWSCNALSSTGKLMFHSNGDRDITLTCGLDNSQINARGGIIGGQIELNKLQADCRLLDPAEGEPLHKLGMKADSLDGKIEYMGGCVMMGQLTQVTFELKDEWRDPVQSIPSNIDKGTVYVVCDLNWRVFQLSISRSTTPDVIKMLTKLEEFFAQQLHSSVRAISSLTQSHSRPGSPKQSKKLLSKQSSHGTATQYDHRRHWPPVFKAISVALGDSEFFGSGRQLRNKSLLLGGSAYLHGDGLTVVCFHGTNFRSKSWVLFNLLQPTIEFSTEVQEIKESIVGHETSTLAIQSLTVTLGHDQWLSRTQKSADPLATVSRVTRSRNQNPPPGSASIAEWFAFMTASRNEELKMLRALNTVDAAGGTLSSVKESVSKSFGKPTESTSGTVYNHEADIIFALPKVQLDFKTEHIQGPTEPDPNDPDNKPIVECTFVTEFTDHICVTMDVELLLFLHDLISSYLKEKQQALSSRTKLSSLNVGVWNDSNGSYSSEASLAKPLPVDPVDLREFICKNWQLEPTVTLISWAGRRIEPVGVDFILQKLGFQHARTTIPKWLQRGVLDVLDKGLAVSVEKLVVAIINEQREKH